MDEMRWTAEELASACGGTLLKTSRLAAHKTIHSSFIDSRNPIAGALFVPIVAARDGHEFIPQAAQGGAAATLLQGDRLVPDADIHVIHVDDTLTAFSALASHARSQISGPVVAITGSNGKTTTRAFTQAVLESVFDSVLCTQGNLNNHLGVPLTLLGTPHHPRAAVLELGMSALGENDHLARICKPDVGIITCIALEHLETMHNLDTIADAESEIIRHISPDGALVIPDDEDKIESRIPTDFPGQVLRFGWSTNADVRILSATPLERTQVCLRIQPQGTNNSSSYDVELSLDGFGLHNAKNAAAAIAAGLTKGIEPSPRVLEALESVKMVGDRGRVIRHNSHRLIADCYNANPGSMDAALQSLVAAKQRASGPVCAVLGDMLELGPMQAQLHREIGERAADLGIDYIASFGSLARQISEGASARGANAHHLGDDPREAAKQLSHYLEKHTDGVMLFKASRGIALERVVQQLTVP